MTTATAHAAVDLGASGGRVMLAVLDGEPASVALHEAHRFDHAPLDTPTGPVWDLTSLWREVCAGIQSADKLAAELDAPLRSVGVDTWGVDWALVDAGGELLGLPHCYRDPANDDAMARVLAAINGGFPSLYTRTGIQQHAFNTLFQLEKRRAASPELLRTPGAQLLLLPDLLHFWLTGRKGVERTNASTTSMVSATTGDWDRELLDHVGLPSDPLKPIIEPGTRLGPMRERLATELGIRAGVEVVAPATHDTASAIAAVPAVDDPDGSWAYLSSGTWSLLGVELDKPNTSADARLGDFTNERGVGGKVRFLRNIAGLWLVQELRRDLQRRGDDFDYAQLAALAAEAPPLRTLVNPNAPEFAAPGDSIAKLRRRAAQSGQPTPETPGQLARCCLDSLALCYTETIDRIEALTKQRIETLYLVGGGVNNTLLNQLTANAIGRPVRIGPSEATALGNALVQAMGMGRIADVRELRAIVARSQPVTTIAPETDAAPTAAARSIYARLVAES